MNIRDLEQSSSIADPLDVIFGADGYFIETLFPESDLAELRSIVNDKYHSVIHRLYPEVYHRFAPVGADAYHENCSLIDHPNTWRKAMRTFDRGLIKRFMALSWRERLKKRIGEFDVLGLEEAGLPDVYMRLVRPHEPSDIGPIHADKWFTELGNHEIDPDLTLIKMWIPVYSDYELDGLLGVPGSRHQEIHYESELRDGYVKPVLSEAVRARLNPIRLPAQPGQAVVFTYDFLHGGSVNEGAQTRVSLEATLILRTAIGRRAAEPSKNAPPSERTEQDWVGFSPPVLSDFEGLSSLPYGEIIGQFALENPEPDTPVSSLVDARKIALIRSWLPRRPDAKALMFGSDLGATPILLAEQLFPGTAFSIVDRRRRYVDATIRNLAVHHLDSHTSVIQGEYATLLPHLVKRGPFDLIILDEDAGAHAVELFHSLSNTGRMVADGGGLDGSSIRRSIEQLKAFRDCSVCTIPISKGLVLIQH